MGLHERDGESGGAAREAFAEARTLHSAAKVWEDEGGGDVPSNCAPLLNRNNGCLSTEAEANKIIIEQAAKWAGLCGADKVTVLPTVKPVKGAGTTESILWRDAERTFKTEPFRQQMIKVLDSG